jgi:hypothetical protein
MEEVVKNIPDQMWKPMGILMLALIAFLLATIVVIGKYIVNKFVSSVESNLNVLSVDVREIKDDLAELVTVSKVHEYRLNEHDEDLKNGRIVKYPRH